MTSKKRGAVSRSSRKVSTPGTFRDGARGRFLRALSNGAAVGEACAEAGVSRNTVYKHRRADADFAAAWAEALEEGTERLEAEAHRRAMNGSDTLLIFLLKARRPEVYRDRYEVHHAAGEPLTAGDLEAIRDTGRRPELAGHLDAVAAALAEQHRGAAGLPVITVDADDSDSL